MKRRALVILGCSLLATAVGVSQEPPRALSVGLVELLATPQRYDGKLVSVRAYLLVSGGHHDIAAYFLCLNREDAENQLGNDILVVPDEQMQRNREKFDRMYVAITGSVSVRRAANGAAVVEIRDVKECRVWSDPRHPILLKGSDAASPGVQR
jgi:hypothetical protein